MEYGVLHEQLVEDVGGRRNAAHVPADCEQLQVLDLLHLLRQAVHLLEAGRDFWLDWRIVEERLRLRLDIAPADDWWPERPLQTCKPLHLVQFCLQVGADLQVL